MGEVAAELYTDFPERFEERRQLLAVSPGGEQRELELQDFWPHKGRIVLKFAGVDDIDSAEQLAGWEVRIPRSERTALEHGSAYVSDLVGCMVVVDGRELGPVAEVQFGAGAAPLLVVRVQAREFMLPLAEEFIEEMAPERRLIRMRVPAGLLELDAPLTAEEKAAQQRGDGAPRKR